MLVRQFKFKRNNDKGGFQWTAESEIDTPGFESRMQTTWGGDWHPHETKLQ